MLYNKILNLLHEYSYVKFAFSQSHVLVGSDLGLEWIMCIAAVTTFIWSTLYQTLLLGVRHHINNCGYWFSS